MKPTARLLMIFFCAAAAAFASGWIISGEIEAEMQRRSDLALTATGALWAKAEVDGLAVTVSGSAPDQAQRDKVLLSLEKVMHGFPLVDGLTVREALTPFQPGLGFQIMRGVGHLTVTGALPGQTAHDDLTSALASSLPGITLTDLTRKDALTQIELDGIASDLADITANLLHGTISVTGKQILVEGISSGTDQQELIEKRLAALVAKGWEASADLATPPSRTAELIFHAESGPEGRGVIRCMAPDKATAEGIAKRAKEIFGSQALCDASVAENAEDWGSAVLSSLDALAQLPAGEVRLAGKRVRLTSAPPTRQIRFEAEVAALRDALPEGYRVVVLKPAGVDVVPLNDPARTTFRIGYDGITIHLEGDAPSEILISTIGSYARAILSGVAVEADVQIRPEVRADDWRTTTMALISALALLESGEATFNSKTATLEGIIEQPQGIPELHRTVAQSVGGDRQITTRVRVSMAERAGAQALPPTRCAEEMNLLVADSPILFAPGRVRIEDGSLATITRLSEILSGCAGGKVEVGGHTDNDGSEASNLSLSRERADAVVAALEAEGVRPSQLSAKGYGEAEPVADNATDAGRRANRRIAFRIAPEGEPE